MGGSAAARFAGSAHDFVCDPGACAPGFMLPPASQVPGTIGLTLTTSQVPAQCSQLPACFAGSEQRLSLLKLTVTSTPQIH